MRKKNPIFPDFSEIDAKFAADKPLGAIYSPERTVFRVWSPPAERATVNLYRTALADLPYERLEMISENGYWSVTAAGNLDGVYYTLSLVIGGRERETIDPYAKSAGANGRRGFIYNPALLPKAVPFTAVPKSRAMIYELHVRDFSMDESADFKARGKFSAFTECGVKNSHGDIAGLDYLADLGITHVHLLPAFDFASVDETAKSPAYNWGYDPLNYFCPEGSYSSDANDGFARVREFKEMVNSLHERGIGVIMDVVFNHVYDVEKSPLNPVFPDYCFRHNEDGTLSNGSGCGNEVATERAMVRKLICDCLIHWLTEYHIDGFRFDLMGLIDIDTLNLCAERLREINPDVLLYGEGWTGGASPLPEEERGIINNAAKIPAYSLFSDEFRDCVKGSVFSDEDCGYINGNAQSRADLMKSALVGGIFHPDIPRERENCRPNNADNPAQWINYTECHDNLTFWDKLALSMPNSTEEERIAADKLGAALIFLSQGVPFIAAGQEFLRSKPLPEGNGFDHNSYKSPDSVNSLKWDNVTAHRDVAEYYKGLIAIRKTFPEFRMESAEEIRGMVSFADLQDGAFLARIGNFTLAVNPLPQTIILEIGGECDVYADGRRASSTALYKVGGTVEIHPRSVLLIRRTVPCYVQNSQNDGYACHP
ncbi:MAG: type I pullulanase [Oscillospiraceae bacterium]